MTTTCPDCGSSAVLLLGDLDSEPADEILYRCSDCGGWWRGEVMAPALVSEAEG